MLRWRRSLASRVGHRTRLAARGARTEIAQLTEAIKSQLIELAWSRDDLVGLTGPVSVRVPAEVKELVLKNADDAVADGSR